MIIRSKAPLRLGLAGVESDVSPYSDIYGGLAMNVSLKPSWSGSPCRKLNRGLFDLILKEHPEVYPSRCIMIGDSPSDMAFLVIFVNN